MVFGEGECEGEIGGELVGESGGSVGRIGSPETQVLIVSVQVMDGRGDVEGDARCECGADHWSTVTLRVSSAAGYAIGVWSGMIFALLVKTMCI